jgi:hypothetical protein
VGGQQPGIGQRQGPRERAEVIVQGHPVARGLEADRGSDERQHMIAREHDLGRGIVKDQVAVGVPRGVYRPQRPGPQVQVGPVGQPVVRVLPLHHRGRSPVRGSQVGDQFRRAELVQGVDAEELAGALGAVGRLPGRDHVRALLLAERDHVVKLTPQLDRERVMVDVDVGDEEVADIAELVADLPQRRGKPVPGRHQGDASVDEVDASRVGDRVDVDRPQPFHRQRQRDPVHASA